VPLVPEGIEVEYYRRAAEAVVGRTIAKVSAPDAWFCKGAAPLAFRRLLTGCTITAARRRGKLLLLDTADDGPVLGLHFGMTGRLIVDGVAPIAELEYGSGRDLATWDRFGLTFTDGGVMRLNDPRRLGGVELDPDLDRLGPDAFSVGVRKFSVALGSGPVAVKARLLDQARLAGIGNLLADETLWRAGIDPGRAVGSLSADERSALHRTMRKVLTQLARRGGSHRGDLHEQRNVNGVCPLDGAPLNRRTIGGRTTFSCPTHQY
jgi:formamidopyrimidine-DNA glycosylase